MPHVSKTDQEEEIIEFLEWLTETLGDIRNAVLDELENNFDALEE